MKSGAPSKPPAAKAAPSSSAAKPGAPAASCSLIRCAAWAQGALAPSVAPVAYWWPMFSPILRAAPSSTEQPAARPWQLVWPAPSPASGGTELCERAGNERSAPGVQTGGAGRTAHGRGTAAVRPAPCLRCSKKGAGRSPHLKRAGAPACLPAGTTAATKPAAPGATQPATAGASLTEQVR